MKIDAGPGVAYIASPYSHPDPAVREARYEAALDFQTWCLGLGIRVFSPIVHSHAAALRGGLPTDAAFWWGFNRAMLGACDRMFVLQIDGWGSSLGMRQEVEEALVRPGFPLVLFDPPSADRPSYRSELRLIGDPAFAADLSLYGGTGPMACLP